MPPLDNHRHELFAQELAKGVGQTEAYVNAGYKRNPSAATRLADDVKVCERVRELAERGAIRAEITRAELLEMFRSVFINANRDEQYSAAVAAADKLARLAGEYAAEKRELSGPNGGPIATADVSSDRLVQALGELSQEQRDALRPLLEKFDS